MKSLTANAEVSLWVSSLPSGLQPSGQRKILNQEDMTLRTISTHVYYQLLSA